MSVIVRYMTHTRTWNSRKINSTLKTILEIYKDIDSKWEIECEIGIYGDFKCDFNVAGNLTSHSNSKLNFLGTSDCSISIFYQNQARKFKIFPAIRMALFSLIREYLFISED